MSSDLANSAQAQRKRELQSRLIPRQHVHSNLLSLNNTVAIKRPVTRQIRINKEKDNDKKQKLPPLSSLGSPIPKAKLLTEISTDKNIETMTDPFEFIEYAKQKNLTTEFVYLYPSNIIEDADHPTRLVIIPASQASREEFWNLSLKGLTHVRGAAVDFIPLNEWLDSLKIFSRVMQIPFFKYQRQWRLFKVWKSYVNREKMRFAQTSLTSGLFYSNRILRPAFIQIQKELYKLKQIKLFSIQPDKLYSLEQFAQENKDHRNRIAELLNQFFEKTEKIVQEACEKTIESINSPEREKVVEEGSPLDMMIAHYHKAQHNLPPIFENGTSLQFTQKASYRAACLKLVRFIRLVDYVVISALRNICFMSLIDFYGILQTLHFRGLKKYKYEPDEPLHDLDVPIEYQHLYSLMIQNTKETFKTSIFRVDVSFTDCLAWKPTSEDVMQKIELIRSEYIDVLFQVPRFLADPLFRPYIAGDPSVDQFKLDKMSTPDFGQIIFHDYIYKDTMKKQGDIITSSFKLLAYFANAFEKAINMYETNQKFDTSFLGSDTIAARNVREVISEFVEQEQFLSTITERSEVGIFSCFMGSMKTKFVQSPKICLGQIRSQIPNICTRYLLRYTKNVNQAFEDLTEATIDVPSFVGYIHACEKHNKSAKNLQKECDSIRDFYNLATEQGVFISTDEQTEYSSLLPIHEDVKKALAQSQEKIQLMMTKFTKMLEQHITKLHEDASAVREISNDLRLTEVTTSVQEAAGILVELIAKTDQLRDLAKDYNSYQHAMSLTKTKFDDVNDLVKIVQMQQLMWETKTLWESETKTWFNLHFNSIDPATMTDRINQFKANAMLAAKELPENAAADDLCATITDFANLLPIIEYLKNPALQQTHKDQIELLLGAKIFDTDDFTFKKLFDLHAFNFGDQINTISTQSANEQTLSDMLAKVKSDIDSLQFAVSPFKGIKNSFVLGGFEEIFLVIENSITIISSIRSSHYISQFRKEADDWIRSLRQFNSTLESLERCQTNWTFIVNILSNSDIARTLSDEVKEMSAIDKLWRNITNKINDDPSAFNICSLSPTFSDLDGANEVLEKVRGSIERYLENKRMVFPRLYYLSNREMLEMIFKSKDPNSILPFLPKLFDGIASIEFEMDNHVLCVVSIENSIGEKMAVRPIKFRSNFETWLSSIEEVMQRSLRNEIKEARGTYKEMVLEDWIMNTSTQISYVVTQIEFCERVYLAFSSVDQLHSLSFLLNEVEQNIILLIKMMKFAANFVDRNKIHSLILLMLYHKEILRDLVDSEVTTPDNNHWRVLMKYNWNEEERDITIDQGFCTFNYGFEFLDCHQRMIITTDTLTSMLSLTNALGIKYGAACYGYHAMGKTETIKELAKLMGIFFIDFNCSATMNVVQLLCLLRGLIQSGTWVNFSNLFIVKPEVLSIIGEHLYALRNASLANLKKVEVGGYEIQLNQNYGVFVTSPAETSKEIPESTKDYFRPVSIATIDSKLIVEAELIAQGFTSASEWAYKITSFINACRDEFSRDQSQTYGMTTIRAILTLTNSMKQSSDPNVSEDQIIVRSIRSICMKSLSTNSFSQFERILNNYFPDVIAESVTDQQFHTVLNNAAAELQLQMNPYLLEKVVQLDESFGIYMGIIILGETCVGKSILIQLLETTYTLLSEQNEQYIPIDKYVICPKTLTTSELWGSYNPENNDWTEGLIEQVFKQACVRAKEHEQWIVFDGNVDSTWIENMNSALDETRTLCFDNLKRIKLNSLYHILFETTDISLASPSSISKCGIVYMETSGFPLKCFTDSKIEKLVEPLFKDHQDLIVLFRQLVEQTISNAIKFIKENSSQLMQLSAIGLINSFIDLFVTLCSTPEFKSSYSPEAMSGIFAFSVIWGLGGHLDNTCRANFDQIVRDSLHGSLALPGRGTIYDWSINMENGQWKHWSECVSSFLVTADDEFDIDPRNIRFHRVIVPTMETVRLSFLMKHLLLANKNIILRGPLGSGRRLLVRTILNEMQEKGDCLYTSLLFSPTTETKRIHKIFHTLFETKSKHHVFQPAGGKLSVLYVQDINTPTPDKTNSSITIELLRQLIALKGYRPLSTMDWLDAKNIVLLGVGLPDSGGNSSIPPRLSRHALNIEVPVPDTSTAGFLFLSSIWQLFFKQYDENIKKLVPKLATVSIQLYEAFQQTFPVTFDKPQYRLSLHDLMRLAESLLTARTKTIQTPHQLERLWVHESFRVFCDRFDNDNDKKKFEEIMTAIVKKKLGTDQSINDLFSYHFGAFKNEVNNHSVENLTRNHDDNEDELGDERLYKEYKNIQSVMDEFDQMAGDYATIHRRTGKDRLTIFEHYAKHVSRVVRVLQKQRGHMLLVGNSCTGKKTITRFAGYLADCEVTELEYSFAFRDELRSIIMRCGINGKQIAVIVNDYQLFENNIIDDVNCIINSIDMISFFSIDDIDKICNDLVVYAKSSGENESHENLLRLFLERATANIHIVICFQSNNPNLLKFLQMYPSFIAMMNVDYLEDWPESAYLQYAKEKYTMDINEAFEDNEELANKYTKVSYKIHQIVQSLSLQMEKKLQLKYVVTPALFMSFVSNLQSQYQFQKKKYRDKMVRAYISIDKMKKIENLVEILEDQYKISKNQLDEKEEHDKKLKLKIEKAEAMTQSLKSIIKIDEEESYKKISQSKLLTQINEEEMRQVKPALSKAINSIKMLQKGDINEVKGFAEPPLPVKLVMEIICILLNVDKNWKSAVMILSDPMFISTIAQFDENHHIPVTTLKTIVEISQDPVFESAASGAYSIAAKTLCLFEKAFIDYETIYRKMEPQQNELEKVSSSITITKNKLKANQDKMKTIENNLDSLNADKDQTDRELHNINEILSEVQTKIDRYKKLKNALQNDLDRDSKEIERMKNDSAYLLGDSFLNTMYFIYLGPFTSAYRAEILKEIRKECKSNGIPISPNYSFVSSILDEETIDKWIQYGLNDESTSIENAIMIIFSPLSSYIIDPYSFASKWLKNFDYTDSQLMVLKPNTSNLLRSMETYVRTGVTVLLEDISDKIDPALDSIIARKTFSQDGKRYVKLNDRNIELDEKFRLFLTTKMHNPQLLPNFYTKATVIMYIPTKEMLEKTELNALFTLEYPELNKEKDDLQSKLIENKQTVIQNETRILELMRTSEEIIIDDDILIDTVVTNKNNNDILMAEIEKIKTQINTILLKREKLLPVTNRIGLLFDISHTLCTMQSVYSYSLEFFRNILRKSVHKVPHYDISQFENEEKMNEKRIDDLKTIVTFDLFSNICDSLYQHHRLMFAFIVACKIMINEQNLSIDHYTIFLNGVELVDSPFENPVPDQLSNEKWNELHSITKYVPSLKNLPGKIISDVETFRSFVASEAYDLPPQFFNNLCDFELMLVIKIVKPNQISHFVQDFIIKNLGPEYIRTTYFSLDNVLELTKPSTPLMFLLNEHDDSRNYIEQLAEKNQMKSKLISFSFGNGSHVDIETLIQGAASRGEWVFIQNIHLSSKMSNELDAIVSKISKKSSHPDFRLFMTTALTENIPISLIRKSVKKSLGQPISIKGSMISLFSSIDNNLFGQSNLTYLIYQITFLHSLLNVRAKYGSYGFHQHFYFSNAAYKTGLEILEGKIDPTKLDLKTIRWSIMNIIYNGGVIDLWDKRCFESFIQLIINEEYLNCSVPICSLDLYKMPKDDSKNSFVDAIHQFPDQDVPMIFGLSQSCDVLLSNKESMNFIGLINEITIPEPKYPHVDIIIRILHDLMVKIPVIDDITSADGDHSSFSDPLMAILNIEASYYQRLIRTVNETLKIFELTLKLQINVSTENLQMINEILLNEVPHKWILQPGHTKLDLWIQDLSKNVDFFNSWIRRGKTFWYNFSAFSNPQAFLYCLLQKHSQAAHIEIDSLTFSISLVEVEPFEKVDDGFIIGGLLCNEIEYNRENNELVKATNSTLTVCPFLKLAIIEKNDLGNQYYQCPVYRIMSSKQLFSGNSNYITSFNLPFSGDIQELIRNGASLYTMVEN